MKAGSASLQSCRLTGRACAANPVETGVSSPLAPVIDGRRLVWSTFSSLLGLFTCRLGPANECEAAPLFASVPFLEPVAIDGPWLATIGFGSDGASVALFACEMDLASSSCDTREIAAFPDALAPSADLSGGRLVWHARGAHGQSDVYFCELGPGAACEVQAITRDAANQTDPRIDGRRLVWVDDRGGVPRVASFELPSFEPVRERRVREGGTLAVSVRVAGPRVPVRFSLVEETRGDADALGARLVDRGHGRALFL